MKGFALAMVAVAALGATRADAQNPSPAPVERPMVIDTPPPLPFGPGPEGPMDPERMRQLRAQVEERWGAMVQQELHLTDQQMDRVRTAARAHQDRKRDLMRRRMDLERGIQRQMQPGVAANNDSLSRMLEGMGRMRVEDAQSDEQLNRDLSFLTPVQRVRFFMMQRRFEERLREIRQNRMGGQGGPGGPAGAPGMRPGRQPGMQGQRRPQGQPRPQGQRPLD